MENATKALLIAAAVLIAIIIISLTLNIVRQGQEAVQNVDMSEAEILAHNSKFTAYEGTNVSASDVNVLLGVILSHNQQAEEEATITLGEDSEGAVDVAAGTITRVSSQARYTVTCSKTNGIIKTITIKSNSDED